MKLQKETKSLQIEPKPLKTHGRWYDDACGTAFGLEVLGERWAMLILRELLFGPRRFSDLRATLPGISAKVLTERLEGLIGWGVVEQVRLAAPASGRAYGLTPWGYQAEDVIMELGRWAARSVLHDPRLPLSNASLMSSMRTMQLPGPMARAADMTIGMVLGAEEFRNELAGGVFSNGRGPVAGCDAVLRASGARPIAGALYADVPLARLESEAGLEVEGDRALVETFLTLFALPPKTAPKTHSSRS